MGLGLSRNLSGGPFSFRLSGNTWLFWVVCSCKMRKYERQGWGLGLLWGQGCHQDGSGQGKEGDQEAEARRERKEAKRGSSVPCWAPATYHHLVAAYQRVIHPHRLKALFQAKAALQGGALQTQGRGLTAPIPQVALRTWQLPP